MNFTNLVKTTLSGFFCALGTMLLFLSFSPDNSTSPIQLADIGAICDLSIEVSTEPSTVCVPPLPPAEDNCDCNGKMQNLTLEYNGPAGATVTVYDDSGTLIATFANVQPGDILFVSAENLNDQEFEAWTSFYTNGGDVTWLHTSCSQDILGDTEGDFTVLGYTDGQGDQCGILGNENYQGCNGSADLTVSNGESPYTYLWSDGSISGDRNDLCAGEYEVTVTDANGCSSTADVVVESDTPEILISVETEANTVCDDSPNPNDCDCQEYIYEFEVEYNGASGILGGAYDYHDNTYLHDTLVTGQVYTFNVSNSNHPGEDHEHNDPMMWTYEGGSWIHHGTIDASCPTSIIGTSYGPFTVLGYTDVHGNVCSTATNCNGSADLTVSNGEAPYTYLWSDGSTSGDRDDLCAGEYQVTVTDANGCSTEIDVEITSDTQDVTAVADVTADAICPEFDVCDVLCFESSNGDDDVSAQMSIDIEEGPNTITLRTIYAKTFCDNTYGDNTIGWPGNHSFGNLRGSDKLELALYNENGDLSLQFELDYIDDEGQGPSGYGTGGVSEGDGDMIVGNEAYILDVKTSLSENFNTYGYVLTENSPATDADYTSNPDYPNWIYEVWYEVTIDLDAFGNSGFGYPEITDFHASPSKTGNNSEPVEFSECCGNGGVECTGSIDLTVTEGVAPFTFAWSNGETTEDIYNLCGGSYSVVVTDANGCSAEYTYEVTCNSTCEIECVNDLTLDCEASTDPNHTGYPTLVCGGYGDCDREAGEFDFAFHGWGGTPVGWGFGPGWQIGTGCDPECGNIPNVFIDFTNFHTDYDTKLKSPIYDACCTDNVYLSFCMQQDLYGGEDVPGFLDVQYRLNAGTWETVYTYNNVFGSTVNYNDTFEIPGAAGNAFEVRFRARGEGSSEFTLGGWGIDDVRVFGHSSGCDSPEEVDIDWSYSDSSNGSCPEVITRTFTGEYNGETFSCIQTLTIVDEEAPIFTSVPDDEEYPCSESIDPSSASAIDNCDDYVTITQSDQIIGFGCTYYIERTFVATDYCGNTASYIQTITINDTEAPEIDCPADVTVECTESLDPSNTGEPVVTDNCSEFDVTYSDGEVSDDCPATFERTWTATDACGNSSSCIQIITINDSEAPEIDCPADVTVECTESLDPSNTGEATATDDCSTPMISYVDGPMMGECPATFERTWTATDACGNSISCVQVITVDDTEAPEIECPADYIVNCDNGSSDPEFAGEPTVEDNCSEFEVTYVDGPATDDCPAVFVRTWTATDACGNASSCTQNITINDFAAPVITCPADVTVECTESLDPSNTGEATAMDDCSTPNVTYVDGPMTGDCPYTVERTWTAVDPCGNETSCVQTITIEDTVAPVLSGEDSMVTIECDASTQIVPPTATDNCDDQVSISMNTETIPGDCANEWTEVYTWTAMDECGNTDVRTFTVNYEDTTAPVLIGVPADDTIDCEAPVPSAIVVATDNCDNDVPVALTAETNYFDCGYEIVRTWTATDDCGNTTSMSQTLTVEDIVAPVITCPADYVVSCDNGSSDPEFSGEPTVEDNCSEFDVTYSDGEASDDCPATFERTWTATDACGNSSSCIQIITINDSEVPEIDCPADVTVECMESLDPSNTGMAAAMDDCSTPIVSYHDGPMMGDCPVTFERTWTATDACGNSISCVQVITIDDTEAPEITFQTPDQTIECDQEIPQINVTFEDSCDGELTVSVDNWINELDCGYEYVKYCSATDNCGNMAEATVVITVLDTTAPEIECPADYVVNCDNGSSDPEFAGEPVVTDNCSEFDVTYSDGEASDDCPATFERTWTATDACGNSSSCIQIITINDSAAPVITCPADVTVECTESLDPSNTGEATAEDDCSTPNVTYVDGPMTGDCPYTVERTWTAVDPCGNETSCVQTITIEDTVAPVLTGEDEELDLECNISPSVIAPEVSDNCDMDIELVFNIETIEGDCPNQWTDIYTWTAMDACGNTTVRTLTFNFDDTQAPIFDFLPENFTVECDQAITLPVVTATDNCSDPVVVMTEEEFELPCGSLIERTWTATDACGNSVSHTQAINVVDTTAPVVVSAPLNVTIECDQPEPTEQPVFSDNCDDELTLSAISGIVQLDCGYEIQRSWTATDDCGNATTVSQTITVVDTTAPVLEGVPADATVECSDIPAVPVVTATDNCDDMPVISFSEVNTGGCPYNLVRTWTAVDNCGNQSTMTQTLTVIDNEAPVLVGVPADFNGECGLAPEAGMVTATDNCDDDVTVTMIEEVQGDSCPLTIVRTWTAVDNCGNSVSDSQTITINDETAPVFTAGPADETVECDMVMGPDNDAIEVEDNCDTDVVITYGEVIIPGEPIEVGGVPCGYEIVRTWTATDDCNNMSTYTQTVTVVDTTAPVLMGVPADVTVECTDLPAAPVVTAMDNCFDGQMNVMFDESTNDLDCGYEVVRTWSASDNCGNMTSETQTITVTDTTAPVVVMTPQDVTIECDEALPTANAVFTDDCDDSLSLTINDEEVDQDCGYYIIRTWTATDDCGNEASTSQSIFVTDTTAPVLVGVPADATVECSDIPAAPIVTATDNCDDIVVPTMVEEIISGDCPYTIERTWTAVDECGNTTESTQVLTVLDETAPVVVSAPMDVTIECDQPEPTEQPVFSDNCDDELTLSAISGIVQLDCGYEIQRTWSATDDCGNSVSVSQTITVVDTTAPVVTSTPADLDLECDEEVPFAAATFSDNCDDNLEVDYNEEMIPGDCENTFTLERTWTAMDDCGNMISTTQTINVSDTTAPILVGVPADVIAECDQVPGAADVTATDNCDLEVTVTLVETTEDATCGYVITRTWTAVDNCGNMDEATQTITVVDTTAPVAEFIPAMITVECDEEIQDASPIFSDNCDELLDIVSNEITEDLACGSTITRTWTATDDCGNEVSTSQTITVVDTTDPVLIGVPADVTAECDDVPAAATVTADDNCAENLEVFFAEGFEATDCGYILTRIWSTSDECGNTASATQIVTVVDTTAPVVVSSPADVTIECDQPEPTDMVVFSDNCDDELTLDAISSINMLDCGYEINKTWFATDDCGNTTSVSQTITVVDTTAPVIIDGPADATVQCDEVPGNGMLNVEDNCDELVDVDVTETIEDQECGYIITRTYTAMDDCGNTAVHVQTITVTDTEAPMIVGVPQDVTIECGDTVPGPGQVDVTDNCDPMPMITSSEMMEDLECGYQIIRTYVATDECGNMSEATQTITVSDFTAPVFDTTPEDITVNCDEVTIAPSLTATDNCDDLVEVTLEEVIGDGCPYTITRTWTAIDECGNTATIDQVVTVIDEVAPVFDPFEVFVALSCDEVDDYIITATDNCGPAQVAIIEELLFSGGCYGTLERTYEATDACGNSVTATQLVQIIDTTAPELFNVPADVEITCGEDIPAIADDVFATDNCTAEVEIEFEEVQSNEFCPYTITRSWTAIDICGNVTEGVQVINVTVEVPEQVALVTYPNPFNDKFTVEFSVPRDADVIACVYDMSGREVMPIYKGEADARRLYSFEYANMNWEAGAYILMITVGDEVYNHKMIVTQR